MDSKNQPTKEPKQPHEPFCQGLPDMRLCTTANTVKPIPAKD